MAKQVNTVCGPIPASSMGRTLVHEHMVFEYPGFRGNTLEVVEKKKLTDGIVNQMNEVKALGLKTFVDATPSDCGRDVLMMKEVSERTGVNVICCTGYYTEAEGSPNFFNTYEYLRGDSGQLIYDIMHTELYEGIGDTGIKAGVIKLSTGPDIMTPYEEKFFKAGAKIATADPDIRIITHTQNGTMGLAQAEYLINAGVNPSHIAIGHACNFWNVDELEKILELGCYLNFDRFGLQGAFASPPDTHRIFLIFGLKALGYGNRIMFSHDTNYNIMGIGTPAEFKPGFEEAVAKWSWKHVFEDILPELMEKGLSAEEANRFVEGNVQDFYG